MALVPGEALKLAHNGHRREDTRTPHFLPPGMPRVPPSDPAKSPPMLALAIRTDREV
jgi:hypothetical protein